MSQKNLREKLDELEKIVSSFDAEDISVEHALGQFETGSKLAEDIERDLADLKTKITVLKDKFDTE